MKTQSTSPLGHATPTPPRKPSTRTVAQRKVYGKKKNNAPRAVFDQKSPAKVVDYPQRSDVAVEAIQEKLAKVSITEKLDPVQEASTLPLPESQGEQTINPKTQDHDEPTTSPSPQHAHTPTKGPSVKAPKKKNYQSIVEVRIDSKAAQPEATTTQEEIDTVPSRERAAGRKTPTARRSSGFVHDTKANAYVRPILNEALSSISSQSIQIFSTWASRSATMFHVAKLAEGSYGEVYKLHLHEEGSRPAVSKSKLARLRAYGDGVFKVVPLRAQSGPGSKKFTSIDEIVSEVKMLKYLDPIPGFARFREVHVVQGRFPETFQAAWDHYKKTKDDCMNPNPANKKAYPDSQLWAIIEMDDAGCELEKFPWTSTFQIYDIFWGVAMALARAEEYALFEVSFLDWRKLVRLFWLIAVIFSTETCIWGMYAFGLLDQMARWNHPPIWRLLASNPLVDLALVHWRLLSLITPSLALTCTWLIFPMILKALSRMPRQTWIKSKYSMLLAKMRTRSC
jgi:serine/threonine-protein kinase haspin